MQPAVTVIGEGDRAPVRVLDTLQLAVRVPGEGQAGAVRPRQAGDLHGRVMGGHDLAAVAEVHAEEVALLVEQQGVAIGQFDPEPVGRSNEPALERARCAELAVDAFLEYGPGRRGQGQDVAGQGHGAAR